MTFFEKIGLIKRNRKNNPDKGSGHRPTGNRSEPNKVALPVNGGRSSISDDDTLMIGGVLNELAQITPDFELKLLEALEHLAKYNADVSFAVDNVVQLGNTEYDIAFDNGISDAQKLKMTAHITNRKKDWYSHSGGVSSLINDLLAQCVITGAISAEVVPNEDLAGIKKTVLVNPKQIRFLYDRKLDEYVPNQVAKKIDVGAKAGVIPLNIITYKYIALRRFNDKPYGIPPFLSALENISIERDMLINLKHVTKQLGVFGFLQVLLDVPVRHTLIGKDGKPLETEEVYAARVKAYLLEQSKQVEKSLATGFIIGDKNSHQFEMKGNLSNPAGARELFQLNTEMKMSGLKQDPLMLGRNFSTTETIGRVILTKLAAQITNYQKLVALFLESLFLLELKLAGYAVDALQVTFKQPMLGDELKNQNVLSQKIANYNQLYQQGVISQTQRAQALGYDTPDSDAPREEVEKPKGVEEPQVVEEPIDRTASDKTTNKDNQTNSRVTTNTFLQALQVDLPEFDYGSCNTCSDGHSALELKVDFGDERMDEFFKKYANETKVTLGKAIDSITNEVGKQLALLGVGTSIQQAVDATMFHVYKNWKGSFSRKQRKIINKWVGQAYKDFKQSGVAVQGVVSPLVDKVVFNFTDIRTLEYFKNSDDLYLGKFITDKDTRIRLTKFIKDKYLKGELPLGNNVAVLEAFKREFGTILHGEEYKLFRIISTTVSKLKNYASISYMHDAKVDKFIIRGVNDRLQCPYCSAMQGKVFGVQAWHDKIRDVVSGDPEYVKGVSPFITAVFKGKDGLDRLSDMSSEDIQRSGIGPPPFHSNCRDTVVAVL